MAQKYRECAGVAQLVRVPACHAGGRGFEPRHSRHSRFPHFFFTDKCSQQPFANRLLLGQYFRQPVESPIGLADRFWIMVFRGRAGAISHSIAYQFPNNTGAYQQT